MIRSFGFLFALLALTSYGFAIASGEKIGASGGNAKPPVGAPAPVQVEYPHCKDKNYEAQFIGKIIKTEPAQKRDKDKGWLCRFKIQLRHFKPADNRIGSIQLTCPFFDRDRMTSDFIEVWSGKDRGCPSVGNHRPEDKKEDWFFSGVVQLTPQGNIEWDATWDDKEPDLL